MSTERPWYMGFVLVARTIRRTSRTLIDHKLGALVPVFGVLVLLALLLWVINSIAPLAPFVYSLF